VNTGPCGSSLRKKYARQQVQPVEIDFEAGGMGLRFCRQSAPGVGYSPAQSEAVATVPQLAREAGSVTPPVSRRNPMNLLWKRN
jgi:hypothetical protein